MNKPSRYKSTVLFYVLLLALPAWAWAGTPPWSGKVVEAVDGDSLIVMRGRNPIEVRLFGVDCPEHGQPWSKEAKAYTARLVGQRVKVQAMDIDRHGRVIGRVFMPGGKELNQELLRAGLAWWYMRYSPGAQDLAAAWWQALQARAGLWSADEAQVPPWEWRRTHKQKSKTRNLRKLAN